MKAWADNLTADEIRARIRYERAPGKHIVHRCPHCEQHLTRSGMCAECWRAELDHIVDVSKKAQEPT